MHIKAFQQSNPKPTSLGVLLKNSHIKLSILAFLLSVNSLSTGNDEDLKALGFEILIHDPVEQAEKRDVLKKKQDAQEEEALNQSLQSLPAFIDKDAWKEDLRLDALDNESPREPEWKPIFKTIEIEGVVPEECCLRASRASRYAAEEACISTGNKVWMLSSMQPETEKAETEQSPPDLVLGKCEVRNRLASSKQPLANTSYLCTAKALAKCYKP